MTLEHAVLQSTAWYAVLSLIAALAYPIVYRIATSLPDRGLTIARPLGLLLTVVPAWWLGNVTSTPFTGWSIAASSGAVGLVAWGMELRCPRAMAVLWRERRTLLLVECLNAAAFLAYLAFRGFHPDIAFTEKPMDLAFLASAIRSPQLPVPDPWLAGYPVNYYVLGYVVFAALAKLTGTPPEIAFNIALATLFALAVTTAFGIGHNLTRLWAPPRSKPWIGGGLAATLLVGVGNLYTPWRLLVATRETLTAGWWEGIGWRASRVIVDSGFPWSGEPRQTINEFPAFSFVLGDLHPHLLDMPFLLTGAALALALSVPAPSWWTVIGSGAVLGAVYSTNTWDMPILAALSLTSLALVGMRGHRPRAVALRSAGLLATAGLVGLPFGARYIPAFGGNGDVLPPAIARLPVVGRLVDTIGLVVWSRSSLAELLLVHGLFLLLGWTLVVLVYALLPGALRPPLPYASALVAITFVFSLLARFPAFALFALPAVFLLWAVAVAPLRPATQFVALSLGLSWLLLASVEVFYLRDVFGDRMNTVFKVYFQTWAIQAVVCGGALPVIVARIRVIGRWASAAYVLGVGVIVLGAATYVPISAYRWADGFRAWQGLDGLAYLRAYAPDEWRAIEYFRQWAPRHAVIVEAPGCSYGVTAGIPHNRMSMATGIPTVLGWDGHEYQWRRGDPAILTEIGRRHSELVAFFEHPSRQTVQTVIERYRPSFVVIGRLERAGQGSQCDRVQHPDPASLEAILEDLGWVRVLAEGSVAVYRAPALGPPAAP